jgi:hypothetical protein
VTTFKCFFVCPPTLFFCRSFFPFFPHLGHSSLLPSTDFLFFSPCVHHQTELQEMGWGKWPFSLPFPRVIPLSFSSSSSLHPIQIILFHFYSVSYPFFF